MGTVQVNPFFLSHSLCAMLFLPYHLLLHKSTIMLFLGPFYDFSKDFTVLNMEYCCVWIITIPAVGI
jgi:hypothetical protein